MLPVLRIHPLPCSKHWAALNDIDTSIKKGVIKTMKSFTEWFWAIWSKIWWLLFIALVIGIFYLASKDPGLLVRLFGILLTVCGIGTILYGVRTRRLQQQSLSWAPATGTILNSEVEIETKTSHRGSHPTTFTYYRPRVTYAYEYQGKSYESRRIIVADINWPKKEAEEAVARYPVHSEVTVWVNPARPKIAILERGMAGKSREYQLVFLIGVLFVLAAVVFWIIAIFLIR